MRTGVRITLTILAFAIATAFGVVAYQAGIDAGVATADGTEVVRVVGNGARGVGFFPGFLLFPFVFFGLFALARFTFGGWGRGWRGAPPHDWDRRAEDWHRRQHAARSGADDRRGSTTEPRSDSWPDART